MTTLNLNVMATVTLTKTGASVYNKWDREAVHPGWKPKNLKCGDALTVPLWQLFATFGNCMYMSATEMPFLDNLIEVAK